jgi:uncharacterized protein YuzE
VRITYDKKSDMVYVYLKDNIKKGEVKTTLRMGPRISVDFDKKMRILGIEIEGGDALHPETMDQILES